MEEDREERAQEYESVLRVISGVLDEAVLLMGDQSVTRTQFAEILRVGFSEARIGIVPRGIDQVQVGDLERSRLDNIRVVLFLGLNDGLVPKRSEHAGLLNENERGSISGMERALCADSTPHRWHSSSAITGLMPVQLL